MSYPRFFMSCRGGIRSGGTRHQTQRLRAAVQNVALLPLCLSFVMVGDTFSRKGRDLGDAALRRSIGPDAPEPPWICRPPAQPGPPRPWEAGIDVSTYCVANAVNRNLFTAIPIVSWSGVGPDMSVTLYHNSAAVDPYDSSGLGPGWSVSYSARLVNLGGLPQQMAATADDGTVDIYTYAPLPRPPKWVPPPGVHDKLAVHLSHGVRRLTHKDGSYHGFNQANELVVVDDGLGNKITITNILAGGYKRPWEVTDHSGRMVEFIYDGSGKLTQIKAHAAGEYPKDIPERVWTLTHDDDRLVQIEDPSGFVIDIGYDPPDPDPHADNGRITSLSDMRAPTETAHTYQYRYAPSCVAGHYNDLAEVTDPDSEDEPPVQGLTQSFSTTCPGNWLIDVAYTNRRGAIRTYEASRDWEPENGPLRWIENPYNQRDTFDFDADRHMISYRDALNHGWDYTYDDNGNLLTASNSEITQVHTWTYDTRNSVTSYTDPDQNTTVYNYEISGYPLLLSSIVEPPDFPGNPEAVTTFDYHIRVPNDCDIAECDHGQLARVEDPNGVGTEYEYDEWGQLMLYYEGDDPDGFGHVYQRTQVADGGSRIRSVVDNSGGGDIEYTDIWRGRALSRGIVTACPMSRSVRAGRSWEGFPSVPSKAPTFPRIGGRSNAELDAMYRPVEMTATYKDRDNPGPVLYSRDFTTEYDELGQVITRAVNSDEWGFSDTRAFTYTYDWAQGQMKRVGPDGMETIVYLDGADRVSGVVRREPQGPDLLRADYFYHPNGLVEHIEYSNGASVYYIYDEASRVLEITHLDSSWEELYTALYSYNKRNLPTQVTEFGLGIDTTTTTYVYDDRGRLFSETRLVIIPGPPHIDREVWYEYDPGGNRTLTVDVAENRHLEYHYDVNLDPEENPYDSDNNRLMYHEVFESSTYTHLSTTYYEYNASGNVTRVVSNDVGSNIY
ncbi:MAG: RHS repeat domain-containing protein, partial [Planctomycetota bacterium]